MSLLQVFATLTGAMKEKVTVTYVVLLMVIAVNIYQLERMLNTQDNLVKMVATEYAFDVIAYGLKDAESSEQMIEIVKNWREAKWGAQIGGIQTICDNAPFRLDGLMTEETKRHICRMAR